MARKPKAFKIIEVAVGAHAMRDSDLKKLKLDKKPEVNDEQRAKAIGELMKYVATSGDTAQVMTTTGAGKDVVYAIFSILERDGADYWVRGDYVPAMAIADSYTLSYLIEASNRDMMNHLVINQILGYFDGITRRLLFPDEKDKLIKITKAPKKK